MNIKLTEYVLRFKLQVGETFRKCLQLLERDLVHHNIRPDQAKGKEKCCIPVQGSFP